MKQNSNLIYRIITVEGLSSVNSSQILQCLYKPRVILCSSGDRLVPREAENSTRF